MQDKGKIQIISNLIKIESVLAELYARFSTRNNFTAPVKKFWMTIAREEELHADIMDKIRQAIIENSTTISVNIEIEVLKGFISKVNDLLKQASSENLSESEAYSMGATIEVEFDESGFTKMIHTTDEKLNKLLKTVENDTKKHRVMLVNYMRGFR